MAMADREKGLRPPPSSSSDAAPGSLWIDYLLLPHLLDQHLASLASGNSSSPSPSDLIFLFLEQAITSHKTTLASGASPAASLLRDPEAPKVLNSLMGKTAPLLCEMAAKVAVVAQLTLTDIESIPSQQYQNLLLKALVKYDKDNTLVRECDLHRWIIHNALQSHPVGFAAPNTASPALLVSSWTKNDESGLFSIRANGKGDGVSSGNGVVFDAAKSEEEIASVSFLENVLLQDEKLASMDSMSDQTVGNDFREFKNNSGTEISQNEGTERHPLLSEQYKCQVMLDIGEVHFMRGRIRRAHDIFTKCGQLVAKLASLQEKVDSSMPIAKNCSDPGQVAPVPRDRLAGFIIACRMVLGVHALDDLNEEENIDFLKSHVDEAPLPCLNAPSAAEQAVIRCEQSRWRIKRKAYESSVPSSNVLSGPGDNIFSREGSLSYSHTGLPPKMVGLRKLTDSHKNLEGEEGHSSRDSQHCWQSKVGVSQGLLSTGEGMMTTSASQGDSDFHTLDLSAEKKRKFNSSVVCNANDNKIVSECDMFISETVLHEELIQVFVDDLLKGELTWGYRFSLEKDSSIPVLIRSHLKACNTVQQVLAGASPEIFLRISEDFEHSKTSVDFLMRLIGSVLTKLESKDDDNHENKESPGSTVISRTKRGLHEMEAMRKKQLISRLHQFVKYVCCLLDKPWGSLAASESFALSEMQAYCFRSQLAVLEQNELNKADQLQQSSVHGAPASTILHATVMLLLRLDQRPDVESLFHLIQADSLSNLETLLGDTQFFSGDLRFNEMVLNSHSIGEFLEKLVHDQVSEICSSSGNSKDNFFKGSLRKGSSGFAKKLAVTVTSILKRKAFEAVDIGKQYGFAMHLYKLVKLILPEDIECNLMQWLLERLILKEGGQLRTDATNLPTRNKVESLPTVELLEYTLLKLIDGDYWTELSEICEWLLSVFNQTPGIGDGLSEVKQIKESSCSTVANIEVDMNHLSTSQLQARKLIHVWKVVKTLGKMMPACFSLNMSAACNPLTEDVIHLAPSISELFMSFLQLLMDVNGSLHKQDLIVPGPSTQHLSAMAVPVVLRISNPKVLMCLASLMAGWLHRCHASRMTAWPLDVERYGLLASITAGASFPAPLAPATSVYRKVSMPVSPDFGRDLFHLLLERITKLPGASEKDKEKGHCWLQGLADLAFEDDDHIGALQYYLQAGAIRTAHYCNSGSSMPRDIFSPWVIGRMIRACRAIGAGLQGAVLCQCLPVPDYDLAFRVLQESLVIMERDMELYSECIWEVPILELLVHMHTKAGDESRVSSLISLLQQPALNVHNPSNIRQAHVQAMEQRFLQRFYEEIC